jgi:diguanylate cyclase (GGDEF)-like protein/PAS domain S-box-containing protein
MLTKVLFVDDEPAILEGVSAILRKRFEVTTALGPEKGLEALQGPEPFAVVVSDLKMPGMDGVTFLSKIRKLSPDTTRMVLTGQADVSAAIEAVNRGNVFRFLTKPCSSEVLIQAIEDGLEINRLILSERALLHDADEQRRRLENILTGTDAGTWEWNVQTGEVVFNERWAQIAGYTLEELAPVSLDTWTELVHPDDLEESERRLQEHFEGKREYYSLEARLRHKSGEWSWVRDHGRVAVWDEQGKPLKMFGTHIDITDMKRTEEQLREASIRDPLTGIFNRGHLFEILEARIAKCRRGAAQIAVAVIDLDHFKAVNDQHGHLAGDDVLKGVAGLIAGKLRPYDSVGRYGGEEFAIVFDDIDRHTASDIVERMCSAMHEHTWSFNQKTITMTFSCGITDSQEFEPSALSPALLIERADGRMYEAKATGRDRIITDSLAEQLERSC